MPDQDIVERRLKWPWKRCYGLMEGAHPPEMIAESLSKSLAAALRKERGIPGLGRSLTATYEAHGRPDGVKRLASVSRTLEQQFQQQPSVKLLSRAAQRNLAQIELGRLT